MTERWSLGKRLLFRFSFLVWALISFPYLLYLVPYVRRADEALSWPLQAVTTLFARHVLGIPSLSFESNGSGDTTASYVMWLVVLLLSALGTAVWSVLGRERLAHPRLAAVTHTLLRYQLAAAMISYGMAKVTMSQFSAPLAGTLDQRIGDISPMRLIWTFMGYSTPYTVFAGLGETVGGLLLLARRTTMLGALIVAVIMTNVVMINLCYDVPVKLYSSELLLTALVILLPSARRLIAAVLGHATPEVPPATRMSPRWERARRAGLLLLWVLLGRDMFVSVDRALAEAPLHDLQGTWLVERFQLDGVEHPPLVTDGQRWLRLSINRQTLWVTDMAEKRTGFEVVIDPSHHTMAVQPYPNLATPQDVTATWTYQRPAVDRLELDADYRGHHVHAVMRLQAPGLLMTRGFHWINEEPFQR